MTLHQINQGLIGSLLFVGIVLLCWAVRYIDGGIYEENAQRFRRIMLAVNVVITLLGLCAVAEVWFILIEVTK